MSKPRIIVEGSGGVVQAAFDRWLNSIRHRFFDKSIFDRDDGNTSLVHRGHH